MKAASSISRPGYCEICNIHCPADDQSHIQGKKHQLMLARLENRHERDERTVFVKGDSRSFEKLSELALSDYFSSFGQVRNVRFLKERGFAFVEFSDKLTVDRALAKSNHVVSLGSMRCRIFINLCRQSKPENLHREDENFRKRKQEKEAKYRDIKDTSLPTYEGKLSERVESESSDLTDQLFILASEIGVAKESVEIAHQVAARVQQVVNLFARESPCRAALFGSKISTLGLRSSDVDMVLIFDDSLLISQEIREIYCVKTRLDVSPDDEALAEIPPKQQKFLQDLGKKQRQSGSKMNRIRFVFSVLNKLKDFSCVMTIKARIPIIRCIYNPTETQLDISVDGLLSINNSHLLKLYSLYDERIRPLTLAIRYWAKIQEICPNLLCFTSYALTWLVLYFLQTQTPPVCPTVAQLAGLAAKPDLIISTWNASYPLDLGLWPKSRNTDSLAQLFVKFFDFYSNFSFGENAIILRDASTVSVQSLVVSAEQAAAKKKECLCVTSPVKAEPVKQEPQESDHEAEPEELFRVCVVNVQDPIELNRNITSMISQRGLLLIQESFRETSKIIHETENGKLILRRIFCKLVTEKTNQKSVQPKTEESTVETPAANKDGSYEINLAINNSVIHSRALTWFRLITVPSISLRHLCAAVSVIGVTNLLKNVLLFDVSVVENNIPKEIWAIVSNELSVSLGLVEPSKAVMDSTPLPMFVAPNSTPALSLSPSSTNASDEILLKLNCKISHQTWRQRDEAATALRRAGKCPLDGDGITFEPLVVNNYGLAWEQQISKFMVHTGTNNITFSMDACFCPKNDDLVCVQLQNYTSKHGFSNLKQFLMKRYIDSVTKL